MITDEELKISNLTEELLFRDNLILELYEIFKDSESFPHYQKMWCKAKIHNKKTLEYLEAKIKAAELAKELHLQDKELEVKYDNT